jgi:acetylcholinesterase/cholinesterase
MRFAFLLSFLALVFGVLGLDPVSTDLGPVLGHYNGQGVVEYTGIRYARAPVDSLRFEPPQSPDPSTELFVANVDAPGCPQACNLPPGNCPPVTDEDCLFLSVFTPSSPAPEGGYDVFVWIHGGAYTQGYGNSPLYNGTEYAMKDIIGVAINYRLGALGFMASESMDGNYGFLDQRLALEWVQRNIKNFGGNPDKVTIGGQSAGGMSMATHMASPNSAGLFSSVIMESNPWALPFHTRETAGKNADEMADYLNCAHDDVACFKSKSVDEIVEAENNAISINMKNLFINFVPFSPLILEGGELPKQPLDAFHDGEFNQVPIIMGRVKNDAWMFILELFTEPLGKYEYNAAVKAIFGRKNGKEILTRYPADMFGNPDDTRDVLDVLGTDLLFHCPVRYVNNGWASNGVSIPSFSYRYEHYLSFDCWGPGYEFCYEGFVCHGSELPMVFNVYSDGVEFTYYPTDEELTLTGQMISYWSNFIKTHDPNQGDSSVPLTWPAYTGSDDTWILFDVDQLSTESQFHSSNCDMWDEMGYFY